MKRRSLIFALLLVGLMASPAWAPPRRITVEKPDSPVPPKVFLYSLGLGDVVWEKFGHSAMCLEYEQPEPLTVCFNYGVTDFANPMGLVWGFVRSKAKFWVEPVSEPELMRFYTQFEHRDVWVQELPLAPDEARSIEAKLWDDIKEENRYYLYDHFFDNCTTRLRDMIDVATHGKLRAGADNVEHPLTFREFGQRGLNEFEPILAVSDFLTGRALDRHPTMWEAMFHPDELRKAVEEKLGATPTLVWSREQHGYGTFPTEVHTGRGWIVLIGLLLSVPLAIGRWRQWRGWRERVSVAVAAFPLMLFGILAWAILAIVMINWIRWNEVCFFYLPIDVVLPFLGAARRKQYARVRLGMVVFASLLCAIGVLIQPLWVPIFVAFVPLALMAFDLPASPRSAAAS